MFLQLNTVEKTSHRVNLQVIRPMVRTSSTNGVWLIQHNVKITVAQWKIVI